MLFGRSFIQVQDDERQRLKDRKATREHQQRQIYASDLPPTKQNTKP